MDILFLLYANYKINIIYIYVYALRANIILNNSIFKPYSVCIILVKSNSKVKDLDANIFIII